MLPAVWWENLLDNNSPSLRLVVIRVYMEPSSFTMSCVILAKLCFTTAELVKVQEGTVRSPVEYDTIHILCVLVRKWLCLIKALGGGGTVSCSSDEERSMYRNKDKTDR